MSARPPLVRATLSVVAATALALVAACGGGSSSDDSTANPYRLVQAGTIRAGTLTDAPPNVYLKDGKFTGFDNDLLVAVAAKLNLKVEFVGTDFSALLSQVNTKKFDVGSSSITITEARKKTVAFTNGYDFGYFGLDVPKGSTITGFGGLAGKRVAVVQGTVQDDYATKNQLNPVRVPDYNSAVNQLKSKTADAWIAPAEIGEKLAGDSNGAIVMVQKQLSSEPTAFAVAKDNDALLAALNKGLDEVIADGTWDKLQAQYYPGRPVPDTFKPGSGTAATPPAAASPSTTG
ncbi:ABC transporter substrate-binding protein [Actinoplanes sp. ATCC 53533]|uniref:ABC transporter substrate-binding protein n=1 Tax=Actinoplanes sp. ATCC 53533 TaxID=1288362 RepID=UPI0018F69920|nr:ABC transporter substrate-binding protein [Actinoplanes sp. ATCC 53533]